MVLTRNKLHQEQVQEDGEGGGRISRDQGSTLLHQKASQAGITLTESLGVRDRGHVCWSCPDQGCVVSPPPMILKVRPYTSDIVFSICCQVFSYQKSCIKFLHQLHPQCSFLLTLRNQGKPHLHLPRTQETRYKNVNLQTSVISLVSIPSATGCLNRIPISTHPPSPSIAWEQAPCRAGR